MSYLLHIATAVPEYEVKGKELVDFYSKAVVTSDAGRFAQKLTFLDRKTKIQTRYSCVPDYNGRHYELFTDGQYEQPVEKRMALYREKIMPLSLNAIDRLFEESDVKASEITHLITVSCTGMLAPGLELLIAERCGLQHTEKTALNFLGCYAAIKALKQANYITRADPQACVLIVSAELCSLHFYPSDQDEELVANLLFADGAAALLVCGDENKHAENKVLLRIDAIGSATIPDTAELMSWQIGSSAFKMHLSTAVVSAIGENIHAALRNFAGDDLDETTQWAIHPGGVKIVEAVQQSLGLSQEQVADSLEVLRDFGNMSSPTVLFILKRIFQRLKNLPAIDDGAIVACAFGPGLTVELLRLSAIDKRPLISINTSLQHDVSAPML